jgi:hypothetical protein
MFIIFGWEKTVKPVESVLNTDCFQCRNISKWSIWRETEWVSLFFIKVIPFRNQYHLVCNICNDSVKLSSAMAKDALSPNKRTQELHDLLVKSIEEHQFAGLTETQILFRKSQFQRKSNV